jgi:hypothetical protein
MIEIATICPECGNYDSNLHLKIALITKLGQLCTILVWGIFFLNILGNSNSSL